MMTNNPSPKQWANQLREKLALATGVLHPAVIAHYTYESAHEMVLQGHAFSDPTVLALADKDGWSIAHGMAVLGHTFADVEILSLHEERTGRAVAHICAENGYGFQDRTIWELKNRNGDSVAHIMALHGYLFDEPEIWRWRNNKGRTVAHEMAGRGYYFSDEETLRLVDNDGWSVAHEMAAHGQKPSVAVLGLSDHTGRTVSDVIRAMRVEKEQMDTGRPFAFPAPTSYSTSPPED